MDHNSDKDRILGILSVTKDIVLSVFAVVLSVALGAYFINELVTLFFQ